MPTIYKNTDAGAPTLTYGASSGLYRFTNFKSILKAALVYGYGAKAAAGWALIDEGDRFIVLRNGSGKYITFVSYHAYSGGSANYYSYNRIYLHATYTGMVANVPAGDGVVSGTASGNSAPHHHGTINWFNRPEHSCWLIVADANTCILQTYGYSTTNPIMGIELDSFTASCPETIYFGDDAGGYFLAAGGYVGTPSSSQTDSYFRVGDLTVLRNPVTGLLVDTGGISAENLAGHGSSLISTNTGASVRVITKNVLTLASVTWLCSSVEQSPLRGLGVDVSLVDRCSSAMKNCLDGTSINHTSTEFFTLAPMADGYIYHPLFADIANRKGVVITDNPGFW